MLLACLGRVEVRVSLLLACLKALRASSSRLREGMDVVGEGVKHEAHLVRGRVRATATARARARVGARAGARMRARVKEG